MSSNFKRGGGGRAVGQLTGMDRDAGFVIPKADIVEGELVTECLEVY